MFVVSGRIVDKSLETASVGFDTSERVIGMIKLSGGEEGRG